MTEKMQDALKISPMRLPCRGNGRGWLACLAAVEPI